MSKYTIESSMKTGKQSPTYGTEYTVKFHESEGTFSMWFKKDPTQGQEVFGEINGNKFKKEKKEWNPTAPPPAAASAGSPHAKPAYRDNSDGMRQGMCFNNAANFVSAHVDPKTLAPEAWAEKVYLYAKALYILGDLSAAQKDTVAPVTDADLASIGDMFGA